MNLAAAAGLALLLSFGAEHAPPPPSGLPARDAPAAHPLHLSTGQLLVERSTAYLRIRMFKDDLEQALAAHAGVPELALEPAPGADSLFLAYFAFSFELRANGVPLSGEILSSGEDLESGDGDQRMWWVLVGFRSDAPIERVEIVNRVLFDHFDDQRNIVRILHAPTDRQRTLYFAAPDDEPIAVRFD